MSNPYRAEDGRHMLHTAWQNDKLEILIGRGPGVWLPYPKERHLSFKLPLNNYRVRPTSTYDQKVVKLLHIVSATVVAGAVVALCIVKSPGLAIACSMVGFWSGYMTLSVVKKWYL